MSAGLKRLWKALRNEDHWANAHFLIGVCAAITFVIGLPVRFLQTGFSWELVIAFAICGYVAWSFTRMGMEMVKEQRERFRKEAAESTIESGNDQ
jgi:hypothetical protein